MFQWISLEVLDLLEIWVEDGQPAMVETVSPIMFVARLAANAIILQSRACCALHKVKSGRDKPQATVLGLCCQNCSQGANDKKSLRAISKMVILRDQVSVAEVRCFKTPTHVQELKVEILKRSYCSVSWLDDNKNQSSMSSLQVEDLFNLNDADLREQAMGQYSKMEIAGPLQDK